MPSTLALEESPRLRSRIRAGVRAGGSLELVDGVRFAAGWQELAELAGRRPGSPVFVDPFRADEGLPEDAAAFQRAHPASPMIFYGDLDADRRRSLEDAGVVFAACLIPGSTDQLNAIGWTVLQTAAKHEVEALARALKRSAPIAAHPFIARLLAVTVQRCRVSDLARSLRVSAPTLRRRCAAWGLPAPRRLVALARLFHVQRLAEWSGKPLRTVALALGWSDYANCVRSTRHELGYRPSELRRRGGAAYVAEQLRQRWTADRPMPDRLRPDRF